MRKVVCYELPLVNGGSTQPIKIVGEKFDRISFYIQQNNTTNKLLLANLGKLWVKMSCKVGSQTVVTKDVKFTHLMNHNNYRAGYVGSDTEYEYQCIIASGTYDGYDEISLSFYLETVATLDSAPSISCEIMLVNKYADDPVLRIESKSYSGNNALPGIVELYYCETPTGLQLSVKSPDEGDIKTYDKLVVRQSKCVGEFEVNQTTPFGLFYMDNMGVGKDITLEAPTTAKEFLVITRA